MYNHELNLLGKYHEQIGLALILAAMIYHVIKYRSEMIAAVFERKKH